MTIAQDAFYIPDDIATGLLTGLYRRIGSVVRYANGPNKGQIVKHLQPIELNAVEQAQGVGTKALQLAKEHKKGAIIVAVGATVGVGVWIYNMVKNREPKVVTEFRSSLRVYIDAIRKGDMDVYKINNLMTALEKLKERKDYEKISIQLTADDLEALVDNIYKYTLKLAEDNKVDLTGEELRISNVKNTGTIINLQNCLKVQKRIFEAAA